MTPTAAREAGRAQPGQRMVCEARPPAHRPADATGDPERQSWIEIELRDDVGRPVPGERYRLTLPDGSVDEGTLDHRGFARVEGLDPGTCKVTFPQLDRRIWRAA